MARIYNELNKGSNSYELKTANALWAQKDYPFLSEYFNITQNYYGGNVTNLDFMGDSAGARSKINAWAEDQTNGRIKNLLSENPDPTTRLILTNAIYFKGKWLMQFDKSSTREMDFWVSNNTSVKVQMMALSGQKGSYAETEDMQILELPYEGEDLSMLILLPREKSIDRLETSLNAEKLSELKGKLQISKVTVLLPRFRFETAYSMAEDLKELGMPTALGNEADFSGMTGAKDLYIGEVVHKAFVEVNEEGTEAAAATEVGMKTASVEISNSFIADHPFIFIIQQKDTGNILFIGRVINPNESHTSCSLRQRATGKEAEIWRG
jgi:serpin B